MRPETSRLSLAVLLALAGCHMAPAGAPVPVEGPETALAGLAGTWAGRYWNEDGQGHGTILFDLAAGADTARGQVEMTFAPALRLYGEGAGAIRGTLAPYWNPACDCRTVSVFEGVLQGSRISGTFVTRRESGEVVLSSGRWRVERQAE